MTVAYFNEFIVGVKSYMEVSSETSDLCRFISRAPLLNDASALQKKIFTQIVISFLVTHS